MAKQSVPETVPEQNSPEWDSYVMSLFQESELIDGNPRVNGLRRVAELLIGEIVSSIPVTVMITPQGVKMDKSTVVYEVQFKSRDLLNKILKLKTEMSIAKSKEDVFDFERRIAVLNSEYALSLKTYADVADTWEGNTDDMFAVHGTATASTKAEARALRKALKIKAVAAEELCKKDVAKYLSEQTQSDDVKRISKDQVNFIEMKCKKLDIDVIKFINSGEKFYNGIYEVKYDIGAKMIKKLTEFSSDKSLIEESIKGYKEGWNQ